MSTPYLYDGENPATISGHMLLNGLGIDERFAQTSPEGTTSYLSDALGSTIGVTDESGSMVGSYSYAPYGGTSFTGSVATPFEFTGRENDGATNLYYYRARYYSSEFGHFISEDPSGFTGGLDLYAYASEDPILYSDPTGRDAWTYYVDYINLVNFISNLNADVFAFVSAEGSGPVGSPVRAAGGLTGLVGYETQSGGYVAGIPAIGALYGGSGVYYGHLRGVEFGLGCDGLTQQSIDMQDIALDLGLDIGGGKYTAGLEAGYFGYFGLGALGEGTVVGIGVGAGPPTQNHVQPWGAW